MSSPRNPLPLLTTCTIPFTPNVAILVVPIVRPPLADYLAFNPPERGDSHLRGAVGGVHPVPCGVEMPSIVIFEVERCWFAVEVDRPLCSLLHVAKPPFAIEAAPPLTATSPAPSPTPTIGNL